MRPWLAVNETIILALHKLLSTILTLPIEAQRQRLISLIAMPVCDVYTSATQLSSLPPPLQCMTQTCTQLPVDPHCELNQGFKIPPRVLSPAFDTSFASTAGGWFAVVTWIPWSWICSRPLCAASRCPLQAPTEPAWDRAWTENCLLRLGMNKLSFTEGKFKPKGVPATHGWYYSTN